MEQLVMIQEMGVYSERQYNRHDTFYGEMTGELASKNRDTQYQQGQLYVVKGFWKHRTWQDQQGQPRHENAFYITDIQTL